MTKLADQVIQRKQRHGENFKDYMVDMQTLMRSLGMSQKETLARIRENSTPALRMFIRPYECRHLDALDTQRERFDLERNNSTRHQREFTRGDQNAVCRRCQDDTAGPPGNIEYRRAKDFGMLPQIGKRHATPASEGQPGFARCCPSKLMGNLKAEERQLSASVLIDGVGIEATVDTGATASFISEELADRLQAAGEVLPTRREVRMADGRYEDVTSMIEVDIGLGERTVRMQLLILHNIIDALVLGWDFLTRVGARGVRRTDRNNTSVLNGTKQAKGKALSGSRGEV
ncbi:GM18756 [Drosophila sechellia]|uniref:GM18756 n=1 Tax=Drosophila sechellia TaxID=7238 RepID=B4IP31_DROSE|nr:GM18756 [Drosophila sechellia]